MRLVDQAEVLKLLRKERALLIEDKRRWRRFSAEWRAADGAAIVLETMINAVKAMETK